MNSNYALDNGLTPHKDAIISETESSPFANIVAVKKDIKMTKSIKHL